MTNETAPRASGWPIGMVLIFGFGGLVLAAVGIVLYLGFSSAAQNTRAFLHARAESILDDLVTEIDFQLRPVAEQADWIAERVANGTLDPKSEEAWDAFASGVLAASQQVTGIAFILPEGTAHIVRRRRDQLDVEDRLERPVPESVIAEFLNPSGEPRSFWTDPEFAPGRRDVVLLQHTALYKDGAFLGILVQGVRISDLSRPLVEVAGPLGVTPFILVGGTRVLAHPRLAAGPVDPGPVGQGSRARRAPADRETPALPGLRELGDPVLAEIWSPDEFPLTLMGELERFQAKGVWVDGERRVFVYREISGFGPDPWIVGAHLNPDLANEEVEQFYLSGAAGLAILLIAVAAAVLIGRRTSRPVQRLARAAEQISDGRLDDFQPLQPGFFRELNEAGRSFNAMVEGLRERQMIRDLFGKYVPETVAAALMKDRGQLEPQASQATILFVDLEGFTTLSEVLKPGEIVDLLNSYFSSVVAVLERHGGVVTQFQGDAILAIFNVPVPNPDHAGRALRAAVEIQRVVGAETYAGRHLACRIGLNTGEVVAGSVGASGRLNYTVHGDAVNLAARLEQLNKEFGTRILAAETTASASETPMRPVGEVTVRGKTSSVKIFTLDGARPDEA